MASLSKHVDDPLPGPLFDQPLTLPCGLKLRNRVIRAAAFAGGGITEQAGTHGEVSAGGAALTTVAYTSVSRDGRTFPSQLLLTHEDARKDLCRIARAVHRHGGLLSFQLTHAGSFAEKKLFLPIQQQPQTAADTTKTTPGALVTPTKAVAPSPIFDLSTLSWPSEASEVDMDR